MPGINTASAETNYPQPEKITSGDAMPALRTPDADASDSPLRLLVIGSVLVAVLSCYAFPYFAWIASKQKSALPPVFGPDVSLYLNLSGMHRVPGKGFINPYYHCVVPRTDFGYLFFRGAFQAFDALKRISGLGLSSFTVIWNTLWWLIICGAALWFFWESLPKNDLFVSALGIAILMLWNFGIMKSLVEAWINLPSTTRFGPLQLPYMRPFFPPIPVALALLYLALQVRALRSKGWANWSAMALVQLAALTSFPYATVIMAAITLVTASLLLHHDSCRWREIIAYGVGCASLDFLWFAYSSAGGIAHPDLLLLNFGLLRSMLGGGVLLLCCATALVAALPALREHETRWVLVGLGVANIALLLGDVLFSPAFLQLSQHGGYFLHMTMSLEVTYLIASLTAKYSRYKVPIISVAGGLLLANGILLSSATYRHFLPFNKEIAAFAETLTTIQPTSADLVISESRVVDDLCAWVPLATPAQTLFCRDAAIALTQQQRREEYRFRQAIYLYFSGSDTQSVEQSLERPDAVGEQAFLAFPGEIDPSNPQSTARGIQSVRRDLIPLLGRVADQDPRVWQFLRQFSRVIVIERRPLPMFAQPNLERFLTLRNQLSSGGFVILEYVAR